MPLSFARSAPAYVPFALMTAIIILLVEVAWIWLPIRREWAALALIVPATTVLVTAYLLWAGRRWECRIEGDTISFQRPQDGGWGVMRLEDIREFVTVNEENSTWREVVFRDGRRVLLEGSLFEPWPRFQQEVVRMRPGISFGRRRTGFCHQCDRPIDSRLALCEGCGARVPTRLPAIRAGGESF
jgi:hypothetical protein